MAAIHRPRKDMQPAEVWLLAEKGAEIEERASATLQRREARFYWANIAQALESGQITPGTDVPRKPAVLRYRSYGGPVFRPATDLAESWEEEKDLLGRRLRRRVIRALQATGPFGQTVLAGSAAGYGRRSDGSPIYRATDGCWYTTSAAEEMIHAARPWTRFAIMRQFAAHASRMGGDAAKFYADLSALVGPSGQGGWEIPEATQRELERAKSRALFLLFWIGAKLHLKMDFDLTNKLEVLPISMQQRIQIGGPSLLGAHDESHAIYLGPGYSDSTLVHELVHWVLTHSGERARLNLSFEAEEALTEKLTAEYSAIRRRK
jgi:hypothetical protein